MDFKSLLSEITKISKKTDINIFIVGGAVRDMLLRREDSITDVDISVEYEFKDAVDTLYEGLGGKDIKFSRFSTASFKTDGMNIDIVTARREIYDKPGMLPKIIPSSIEDDLRRRDFTINSIAYNPASKTFRDILGGRDDLERGIIRQNREGLFTEDPTRIFRLVKYAARFGFDADKKTMESLRLSLREKQLFKNVSKSRISREWKQIAAEPERERIVDDLIRLGVFDSIFGTGLKWNVKRCSGSDSFQCAVSLSIKNGAEKASEITDVLENGLTKSKRKDIMFINRVFAGDSEAKSDICKKYPELLKEYCDNIHS